MLCGVIWGHFRRFQALRGQMDFRQYTTLCIFILYIALFTYRYYEIWGQKLKCAIKWAFWDFLHFYVVKMDTYWSIIPIHANPWWLAFSSVFLVFPSKFSKVRGTLCSKTLQKSFKKGLVIPLHLWYISVNKNSPRPAEVQ